MKQSLLRSNTMRLICAPLIAVALILTCGLTVFAAEDTTLGIQQVASQTVATESTPSTPDTKIELYPADVQTVINDEARQIVKTYVLTVGQSPNQIPRDGFERDGWRYTLTDITEKRNSRTDTQSHTETVEINTATKDLDEIIKQLAPTLDYQSEDGYHGILNLDLSSVKCDTAGYKKSTYTVTATREYPNLSTNDLSLIPKSITDNGRTLQLDDVSWQAQTYATVDYDEIPASYRAVAKYTGTASKSVVTGYVTTAQYSGEITKIIVGDTVYTAYFTGNEINPAPTPTPTPEPAPTPTPTPEPTEPPASATPQPAAPGNSSFSLVPVLISLAVLIVLGGAAAALFFLRRNVRVYRDGFSELAAKDRISVKNPIIDLSPLDGECFGIEIDKFSAKSSNGITVEIRHGSASLKHQIAYEGNSYRIKVDFGTGTIQAIY